MVPSIMGLRFPNLDITKPEANENIKDIVI